VYDVAQNVNLGLIPGDERPVVPDIGGGLNGHEMDNSFKRVKLNYSS
jgi:hypothetical protein